MATLPPALASAAAPLPTGEALSRTETIWRSLTIFCRYRLVIAIILALSYWGFQRYQLLVTTSMELAGWSLGFYFLSAVALAGMAEVRSPGPSRHLSAQVLVDVVAMTLLMHASGGIRSGIGLLLLVTLAASALVARGRIAYFHAAVAALAILLEQSWQFLVMDAQVADFVQTGLLAGSYFVIAGLAYTLAKYAEGAERIAALRGVDLANLAQINELVIRDMQDGFVVVDENGIVRQHNPQSELLIGGLRGANGRRLADVSGVLAGMLDSWRRDPERTFSIVRDRATQRDIQVRFVAIGRPATPENAEVAAPTVVFIEDAGRIRAQAQQMKLVALGHLTASIAHEIRNPLSSINHAAELMHEDAERSGRRAEDARLLTIIRDNAYRLDRMVQEVLYLNRRDRAQPEPIDVQDYLGRFLSDFAGNEKLDPAIIEVRIDTQRKAMFDRSHFDQVLWNLVRNACHHSGRQAGSVLLHFHEVDGAGVAALDIIDDGPGVSGEAIPHLFEPFFTTASTGTGLGLYIARELADVNAARLEFVTDVAGNRKGACFRITFTGVHTSA